jgi:Flp pilus assembly protein CpaB
MRKVLILDARDNIVVCLADLNPGDKIEQDDITLTVLNPTPRGHKIASRAIAKGEGIIKYGERMGHAIAPIAAGEHVHVHNILGDRLSTETP